MVIKFLHPLGLLLFPSLLAAQSTVQIDFGRIDAGQPTPDAGWNNVTAEVGKIATNITNLPDLIDSDGNPTGISLDLVYKQAASGAGAGADWFGPYPAEVSGMPATAISDSFFTNTSGGFTMTLSGLNSGSNYDIMHYGARGNNGTPMNLIVTGSGEPITENITSTYQNSTEVPLVEGVIPDLNGEITIQISNGAAVNVLTITELIPLDTDEDGMPDQYETANGTDPVVKDGDLDKDDDGLSNLQEYLGHDSSDTPTDYGQTLSGTADTDGDGVEDGDEISGALNPWQQGFLEPLPGIESSNPRDPDTDDDGLSDGEELSDSNGSITDPNWSDSDLDFLEDAWEIANGLDPTDPLGDNGADGDPDGDNLLNADEFAAGTFANNPDSDNDELKDGDEVYGTLNPYQDKDLSGSPPSGAPGSATDPLLADTDSDGILDGAEISASNGSITNPTNKDTDGDELADGFEVDGGLDPLVSTGDDGIDGDPDGDELPNSDEQLFASDPSDNDTDNDTLLDGAEVNIHDTDPTLKDTDRDLLDDNIEVAGTTSPILGDTDNDGHKDYIEIEAGSDPDNIDSLPSFPAITWSADDLNNVALLNNSGTLLYAENYNGPDTTANGITFLGRTVEGTEKSSAKVQTLMGLQYADASIYDDEVPELSDLFEAVWYQSATPQANNIGLTGLTPGKTYLIQFGRADDRNTASIVGRWAFADGFGGSISDDPVGPTNTIYGGPANPALLFSGTFTATSTVQGFAAGQNLSTGAYSGTQLAFIQVREIEGPSTFSIVSAGFNAGNFEAQAIGLDPGTSYQLVRSANLTDGFPVIVDGPRVPAGASDIFIDTAPPSTKGFYRLEEAP